MSAVAIIPARGGSRRIPRKNIRMFHGKPIIAYSIEVAKESGLFGQIIVSSDDYEIGRIAESYGADHLARPPELAKDEVGTQEVMQADVRWATGNPDFACCIYPCAPMMTAEDLRVGFDVLQGYHDDVTDINGFVYVPGYYYWGRTSEFLSGLPIMEGGELSVPANRYIDINTPEDWSKAEAMYAALHPEVA